MPRLAHLVMTVHPECPCSRASVGELEVLMTRCRGRLNSNVLFVEASGFHEDSAAREPWQSASRISGVTCRVDSNNELSNQFRAVTSGEVFMYDASDFLKFNAGITALPASTTSSGSLPHATSASSGPLRPDAGCDQRSNQSVISSS